MRTLPRFQSLARLCLAAILTLLSLSSRAWAVSSSELYTTSAYKYGRFEARVRFALGDGVISSFFLWKDGSEMSSVYWNELDFEKLRANCAMETNALYGLPEMSHSQVYAGSLDLCGSFHTYAYEWTPDYIAWLIDGVEIRREAAATASAFRDNAASAGMQIHFNIWPGDSTFGGNFDPKILPLYQYVNWVQYSAYSDGKFELSWREDFDANRLPSGWSTGSWGSPKNLSTHAAANVNFVNGFAVLSLTSDDATGAAGVNPVDTGGAAPPPSSASASSKPAPSSAPSTSNTSAVAPSSSSSAAPAISASSTSGAAGSSAVPTTPLSAAPSIPAIPSGSASSAQTPAALSSSIAPSTTLAASGAALTASSPTPTTQPSEANSAAVSASSTVDPTPTTSSTAAGCNSTCQLTHAAPGSWGWAWLCTALALGRLRRFRINQCSDK